MSRGEYVKELVADEQRIREALAASAVTVVPDRKSLFREPEDPESDFAPFATAFQWVSTAVWLLPALTVGLVAAGYAVSRSVNRTTVMIASALVWAGIGGVVFGVGIRPLVFNELEPESRGPIFDGLRGVIGGTMETVGLQSGVLLLAGGTPFAVVYADSHGKLRPVRETGGLGPRTVAGSPGQTADQPTDERGPDTEHNGGESGERRFTNKYFYYSIYHHIVRISASLLGRDGPLNETQEAAYVVTEAVADDIRTHLAKTDAKLKRTGAGAAIALLVGLGLLYFGFGAIGLGIAALGVGGGGIYAWWQLQSDPDVTVVNAKKQYWTGHIVPQPEGAFVYDATGSVATTEFEVEEFEDMSLLHESIDTFSENRTLPVVQTPDQNVEATIQQRLSETQAQVDSAETIRFEAPIADTTGEIAREIQTLPIDSSTADVETESIEFDLETATNQVDQIRATETMAFETDAEETLRKLEDNSKEVVQTLTQTKEDMVRRLNDHVDIAGEITSITSYNFYCPDCIEDDIYSKLDLEFGDGPQWFCETCREQFGPEDDPVPKHRIKDELVEDIWDRLWIEKDDQRRGIYENVEDQKTDLTEREFEQRQEAIRNTWNRIKDIRSKIRDLETEAKAERGSISEVGEVMEKYDRLATERRQEFEADVAEAVDRIERETQEAIDEMRDYEEQKIEESQQAAEERAEVIRAEEQARHKEKMAKLENIEESQEELLEHEQEAHQREMLMESRGGTSMFGVMNKFQMAKGKIFGFSKGD